jgi:hypothetical protein
MNVLRLAPAALSSSATPPEEKSFFFLLGESRSLSSVDFVIKIPYIVVKGVKMNEQELAQKISDLENKLNSVTEQVQQALNNLVAQNMNMSSRAEANVRHNLFTKKITLDDLLLSQETYNKFREALIEISKLDSIPEKLEKAIEYNKSDLYYHFPIYADDLNLEPIFEKMGGPSTEIALRIRSAFQMSSSLKEYLDKYTGNAKPTLVKKNANTKG